MRVIAVFSFIKEPAVRPFNESPVTMLNKLIAAGRPERVSSSESGDVGGAVVVVPPLVVRDFSFTSVSEARVISRPTSAARSRQ